MTMMQDEMEEDGEPEQKKTSSKAPSRTKRQLFVDPEVNIVMYHNLIWYNRHSI